MKSVLNYLKNNVLLMCFIALVVIVSLFVPNFLKPINIINIIMQVAVTGMVAMGVAVLVISGCIDLSIGAAMATVTVVVALMLAKGIALPFVFLSALATGVSIGSINGFLITKGKIEPFIATLGTAGVYAGVAQILCVGVPIGITNDSYNWLGNGKLAGIPIPVFAFVLIVLFFNFFLKKTRIGRYAYAIGGNEKAARAAGIDVFKYRQVYYMITGALVAVAAVFLSARVQTGSNVTGIGTEFDALIACIIGGVSFSGGVGKVYGAVIGLLIIGVINNTLDLLGIVSYYQVIVKGIIIIITMWLDANQTKK